MKHLLRTASFAKTFPEAHGFDNKYYVEMVRTLVILSKIRNSHSCARAITYNQFKFLKPKTLLTQLLRFHDYQLAMEMIEQLDMKQYTYMIYDDWCQALIRHSTGLSDSELQRRLEDKFNKMKINIASEIGIDVQSLKYNLQGEELK